MSKQIKFSKDSRSELFKGIETVAKAIIITMGPKGRNVILEKESGNPLITNDGATIASEIVLENKFENMGASLIKEAAERTNNIAGDGTTTATLLTYALIKEGLKYIKVGVNPVELKKGMKRATQLISEELTKNSKLINSKEEISQVASISAQDKVVGEIIAQAMKKVGNTGVISVEEGQSFDLELEITEGMEFDNGYLSPYMISNEEKMLAEISDTPILITDKKIGSTKELIPLLEQIIKSGKKDLVLIAEDLEGDTLTGLVLNKMKGILNILAIKSPGFGDSKKDILKDLAILTGANIITSELGMKLENTRLDDLGYAKKVISSKGKTMIIGGGGDIQEIENRVEEIHAVIPLTDSDIIKDSLAKRIAKLAGGVAVIKVGAASEVEVKEKKLRIEDALNATKAAISEGVVAGGGVALFKASEVLDSIDFQNEDQNLGVQIVQNALSSPIKQIIENSGKNEAIIENIKNNTNINYGYDAAIDKYVDMIEVGIIDPKMVERVALEEAVSLAGMFLTTEVAITTIPGTEEEKISPSPQVNPGMGMF